MLIPVLGAQSDAESDYSGMQEVMVVHYLDTLGRFLEELGEDR